MATATKAAVTFQASASNTAGSTLTGSAIDLTTALGCVVMGKITNGGTGPTIGCDFVVQVSEDNSTFREFARATAPVTNSAVTEFAVRLPKEIMYAKTVFTGNTGQTVTCESYGQKVSSIG